MEKNKKSIMGGNPGTKVAMDPVSRKVKKEQTRGTTKIIANHR